MVWKYFVIKSYFKALYMPSQNRPVEVQKVCNIEGLIKSFSQKKQQVQMFNSKILSFFQN